MLEHQTDPIGLLKSFKPFVGKYLVVRVPEMGMSVGHPLLITQGALVSLLIRAGYDIVKTMSRQMEIAMDLTAIAMPRSETRTGRDAQRLQA